MRLITLLILCFLWIVTPLSAQDRPEFSILQFPVSELVEELELSEDQIVNVWDLEANWRDALEKERDPNDAVQAMQLATLENAYLQGLHEILTETQMDRYQEMLAAAYLDWEGSAATDYPSEQEQMQMVAATLMVVNEQYILPLREIRTRFDTYLGTADRRTLDRLRRLRAQQTDWLLADAEREMEEDARQKPALAEANHALFAVVDQLFRNYPLDITLLPVLPTGRPDFEWDAEAMSRLVEDYVVEMDRFTAYIVELRENTRRQLQDMEEPGAVHFYEGIHLVGDTLTPAFMEVFLLMEPLPPEEQQLPDSNPFELSAFPTPAKDHQTISFNLPAPGLVTLDVIDGNGNVVDRVYNGQLPEGLHRREVNIAPLPDGLLYYRLSHPSGVSTLTVVIER
ncbi:MAG: hypothetical protein KDC54_07220 [Lewinella sp.]|nr:hypothetical protein [Lewinella sp.]